ncbi:MAG: LPS-assembly protein LptD [Acuticoccus sp.]
MIAARPFLRRFAFALAAWLAPAASAQAQLLPEIDVAQPGAQMLVEADELIYNVETGHVTALGNVFIHYQGFQLFANEVAYDQRGDTLTARNGVRLEEPTGNLVIAKELRLSEDFKDGFATGLRADTIYRTRLGANRATRSDGNVTIFEEAGYTACYSCLARPDKPPSWAIKARRVIAREDEKTLRFEEPRFEVFGIQSPTLPSFSIPDPSVERQSGFLIPTAVYSNLIGFGVRNAYFKTLGPYRDITIGVTPLTRQGVFGDVEYRQRTRNGIFDIRATSIYQFDPDAFEQSDGDRHLRGSLTTSGNFFINPRWQWGWEGTYTTDRRYLDDYKAVVRQHADGAGDALPQRRSASGISSTPALWGFRILQDDYNSTEILNAPAPFSGFGDLLQAKQAIVSPVIDYEGIVNASVVGGELSYAFNTTLLNRQETDAFGAIVNGVNTARFRGVEGTYGRMSAELGWRRQIMAPLGQVITPFAGARGDLFYLDNRDPNVTALGDQEEVILRGMPWAGINYRYPWLVAAKWGTQTFEPIAEFIAAPNETSIGRLPNEDAQSVVFDDSNLFGPSKFSGYDRVAGGVRANVGVRYTLQTYSGAFLSAAFGQSYHLAGRNSYAIPDILDSTGNSGLSSDVSDYVADVTLNTNGGFALSANTRLDDDTLSIERAEVSAASQLGPLTARIIYAYLARQEDLGFVEDREEIQGAASLRVFDRVRVFGQIRYDMEDDDLVRQGAGIAYDDDALSLSLAYSEDRGGVPEDPVDRTIFFRIGLRTLGDTSVSTGLDN